MLFSLGGPLLNMADRLTRTIIENYDKLAKEYALHLFDELQHKPFDREVLTRFAHHTKNRGAVCDLGCGPGHVTRFLNDLQASVFGVDVSPNMVAEARRLNPGLDFREGDMLALESPTRQPGRHRRLLCHCQPAAGIFESGLQ